MQAGVALGRSSIPFSLVVSPFLSEVVNGVLAEDAQKHTALGLGFDQSDQLFLIRDADVEIAVRGQNYSVRAVLDEVLGGDVVRELDARAAVGRAARP